MSSEQAYEVLGLRSDGSILVLLIGLITGAATVSGGALAFRFQSALGGLFFGFSSGAIIGVALFDLLPEAFELGGSRFSPLTITTAVALGFALYLTADGTLLILTQGSGSHRAHLGPSSLTSPRSPTPGAAYRGAAVKTFTFDCGELFINPR
jgi:zinc transporter ZupT